MNILKSSKTQLAVAVIAAAGFAQSANAAPLNYSENFEALDQTGSFSLALAGWSRYTSAWLGEVGGAGLFLYDYQGAAANAASGVGQMSAIGTGEGGVDQGANYINVFSDYNNADQGTGALIDVNIFQQFTVGADDIGNTYTLTFDAKAPAADGVAPPSTATAFIKTLDQNNGYATTNAIVTDMTSTSTTDWASFSLVIDLTDPLLEGQLLQIGFNNTTSAYGGTGVYYDNIDFSQSSAVPVPAAAWLFGSALVGLAGIGRKRSA